MINEGREAFPVSSKYKNNWAVNIFAEWLRLREVQEPVLDCGGLFKDYELLKVQAFICKVELITISKTSLLDSL